MTRVSSARGRYLLCLPLFDRLRSLRVKISTNSVLRGSPGPFHRGMIVYKSDFARNRDTSHPNVTCPGLVRHGAKLCFIGLKVDKGYGLRPRVTHMLTRSRTSTFIFSTFSGPQRNRVGRHFSHFIRVVERTRPAAPLVFLRAVSHRHGGFSLRDHSVRCTGVETNRRIIHRTVGASGRLCFVSPSSGAKASRRASASNVRPSSLKCCQ